MENNNPNEQEQESAVFNMALDTLKRLGEILREIKGLNYKIEYNIHQIQQIKVGLVKQFFIQASPLLPEKKVKEYQKEVLDLIVPLIAITKRNKAGIIGYKQRYNQALDIRCNEILIELQLILQNEKYFMPSAEEEGDF